MRFKKNIYALIFLSFLFAQKVDCMEQRAPWANLIKQNTKWATITVTFIDTLTNTSQTVPVSYPYNSTIRSYALADLLEAIQKALQTSFTLQKIIWGGADLLGQTSDRLLPDGHYKMDIIDFFNITELDNGEQITVHGKIHQPQTSIR